MEASGACSLTAVQGPQRCPLPLLHVLQTPDHLQVLWQDRAPPACPRAGRSHAARHTANVFQALVPESLSPWGLPWPPLAFHLLLTLCYSLIVVSPLLSPCRLWCHVFVSLPLLERSPRRVSAHFVQEHISRPCNRAWPSIGTQKILVNKCGNCIFSLLVIWKL